MRKYIVTGEEHHRALEQWERDFITKHWREYPSTGIAAMLMLYTGERPSEARAQHERRITTTNVGIYDTSYFDKSGRLVIKLDSTKTEAGEREVPLLDPLRDALKDYNRRYNGLIWSSSTGGMLTHTAEYKNWCRFINTMCCIKMGFKKNKAGNFIGYRMDKLNEDELAIFDSLFDFSAYSLRHTYCTMLYEAGVDLKTAQYYMGHKDIQLTLNIYTHLSENKEAESREKLMNQFTSGT